MTKERYKSIDILKGIAIIMVILVHYNQQFSNGVKLFEYFQMGCPIFFVISGFSIALLISRKFEDIENRDTRKRFYLSRLKAIAPAWYLTFIVIYLINLITYLLKNNVIDLVVFKDPLAVIGNLFFLNGIIPSANYSFMPGGWFIGTLVILYLLTPFVIDLMNKKNTRMIFIITSSISIMLLVVIKLLFNQTFIHNGFGYFLFLNHYPSYCLGIMLFYELKNKLLNEKERKVNTIISIIAYLIAILVFLIDFVGNIYLSSWLTALATYFLLYSLISYEKENDITNYSYLSKLGRNSYCIYLFHSFIVGNLLNLYKQLMISQFNINVDNYIWFIILLPVIVILSCWIGIWINSLLKILLKKTDNI